MKPFEIELAPVEDVYDDDINRNWLDTILSQFIICLHVFPVSFLFSLHHLSSSSAHFFIVSLFKRVEDAILISFFIFKYFIKLVCCSVFEEFNFKTNIIQTLNARKKKRIKANDERTEKKLKKKRNRSARGKTDTIISQLAAFYIQRENNFLSK